MEKLKYCKIRNKGYGQKWQDFKIHYVGARPKLIRDDGAFSSGKSLLEALAVKFGKFELVLAPEESRIQRNSSAPQVWVALPELQKMNAGLFTQKKEVTQRAVSSLLSGLFPKHFANGSQGSRPTGIGKKRVSSKKLKARFNLGILRRLAKDMKKRVETSKSEGAWRNFLRQNILNIQRGYIELIPKADLEIAGASYPDFLLASCDGYLDILEIKTPFTALLSYDEDRKTHVWSAEIAAGVARVENHLQSVADLGDRLRKKVKNCCGIELPAIKPRGIIVAGNSVQFEGARPTHNDFERLNEALQNINVVTYDELLMRLRNHLTVLTGSKEGKK